MDHQKIPTLVIEHCLCDGCKIKLNKLNDKIPQVHSIKFYTEQGKATISGPVDPATVMEELAKEGIKPKILWEKSSPINKHHQQKQIVFPEHSLREQVHRSGSRVHCGEQVRQSRSKVSRSGSQSRSGSRSRISQSGSQSRSQIQSGSRSGSESRSRVSRSGSQSRSESQNQSGRRNRSQSRSRSTVSSRSGSQSRSRVVPRELVRRESHKLAEFADCYLNHKHELEEVKGFNKRFTCDGCKEDGFKSRYRCERCNFDLHHECRFPKLTISPEINEKLVFEFRSQKPPKERICDACGKDIHGCFYNCQAKGMDLHPCCARLKAQVRNHDMVLLLRKVVSSECLCCRKKQPPGTEQGIPGWCYVSQCKKYNIHILCVTQMLHQAWQRGLMDGTGENSIRNINFQRTAVSDGNRGGRGTEVALKIIGILRIVIGILLGDPSVLFGKLMFEFLEQLL